MNSNNSEETEKLKLTILRQKDYDNALAIAVSVMGEVWIPKENVLEVKLEDKILKLLDEFDNKGIQYSPSRDKIEALYTQYAVSKIIYLPGF